MLIVFRMMYNDVFKETDINVRCCKKLPGISKLAESAVAKFELKRGGGNCEWHEVLGFYTLDTQDVVRKYYPWQINNLKFKRTKKLKEEIEAIRLAYI
jgi:hypothetical protein